MSDLQIGINRIHPSGPPSIRGHGPGRRPRRRPRTRRRIRRAGPPRAPRAIGYWLSGKSPMGRRRPRATAAPRPPRREPIPPASREPIRRRFPPWERNGGVPGNRPFHGLRRVGKPSPGKVKPHRHGQVERGRGQAKRNGDLAIQFLVERLGQLPLRADGMRAFLGDVDFRHGHDERSAAQMAIPDQTRQPRGEQPSLVPRTAADEVLQRLRQSSARAGRS